jgi:hypothetical protein
VDGTKEPWKREMLNERLLLVKSQNPMKITDTKFQM